MARELQPTVFTSVGAAPEAMGYALAKFSRSARPYQEWLMELTQAGAEKFYETFYFSYGHASIADLDHINTVAENIPIVWAAEVYDESLVDGQESSTRYQDFSKRRFYTPEELLFTHLEESYREINNQLFDTYHALRNPVVQYLLDRHEAEKPADLPNADAQRTLNARAFDNLRYLLPASTYTGLGIIHSARTAEKMVNRLLSHPTKSMRTFGEMIKVAIKDNVAFNPVAIKMEQTLIQLPDFPGKNEFVEKALGIALKDIKSAPTLLKYTGASAYQQHIYSRALPAAARQYLGGVVPESGRGVALHLVQNPEIEIAATALYRSSNHSFKQALEVVQGLESGEIKDLVDLLFATRGNHDDPVRETLSGRGFIFDIETDNGAFRDLNRHRACVKVVQDMSAVHGYDVPVEIELAGMGDEYRKMVELAGQIGTTIDGVFPGIGQYALPLAYRRKFLMKMDSLELQYIVENRTPPDRHFSYREIAYDMFELARQHVPNVARYIQAVHPSVGNFWGR